VRRVPDAAAARAAICGREVYGAFVAMPDGLELQVASAASPIVAELLERAVERPAGRAPPVVDVAPAASRDPRGAAFGSLVLALTLVSVLAALAVMTATAPGRSRSARSPPRRSRSARSPSRSSTAGSA
jgi:hypothetical protein